MIVDRILDRKDGEPYNASDFYNYCLKEMKVFGCCYTGGGITRAMDSGINADVQEALPAIRRTEKEAGESSLASGSVMWRIRYFKRLYKRISIGLDYCVVFG